MHPIEELQRGNLFDTTTGGIIILTQFTVRKESTLIHYVMGVKNRSETATDTFVTLKFELREGQQWRVIRSPAEFELEGKIVYP
jgi:hypothetical protein